MYVHWAEENCFQNCQVITAVWPNVSLSFFWDCWVGGIQHISFLKYFSCWMQLNAISISNWGKFLLKWLELSIFLRVISFKKARFWVFGFVKAIWSKCLNLCTHFVIFFLLFMFIDFKLLYPLSRSQKIKASKLTLLFYLEVCICRSRLWPSLSGI